VNRPEVRRRPGRGVEVAQESGRFGGQRAQAWTAEVVERTVEKVDGRHGARVGGWTRERGPEPGYTEAGLLRAIVSPAGPSPEAVAAGGSSTANSVRPGTLCTSMCPP